MNMKEITGLLEATQASLRVINSNVAKLCVSWDVEPDTEPAPITRPRKQVTRRGPAKNAGPGQRMNRATWTKTEDKMLRSLRRKGTPYPAVAAAMGRTLPACVSRMHTLKKKAKA